MQLFINKILTERVSVTTVEPRSGKLWGKDVNYTGVQILYHGKTIDLISDSQTKQDILRDPALPVLIRILSGPIKANSSIDRKKSMQLVDKFKIAYKQASPKDRKYLWNGFNLGIRQLPNNIVHDIAHYQLASKDRRFTPEFGLGPAPDTLDQKMPSFNNISKQQAFLARNSEEEHASLLGILWELYLGMTSAHITFVSNNWFESLYELGNNKELIMKKPYKQTDILEWDAYRNAFHNLLDKGFINAKGEPQFLLSLDGFALGH